MKAESIVFAIAGMCFGVILGWVLATQQAGSRVVQAGAAPQAAAPAGGGGGNQAAVLDEARVQALQTILSSDPQNAGALVALGNTYFDAQQFPDAIRYYEQSLTIDPTNVDASTDLGVSYYYSNRADDALKQFEVSLTQDPRHTKTLLNKGIVLAFGKNDLDGAAFVWNQVVDLAPASPEAEAARRGLDGIAASRANGSGGASGGGTPGSGAGADASGS